MPPKAGEPKFDTQVANLDATKAITKFKKDFAGKISQDDHQILLRPGYGNVGIPTEVGVNFFKYAVAGLKLYSYHVDVKVSGRVRLKIKGAVEKLLEKEPFKSKRSHIYYRDHNMMYSRTPLPIENEVIYPVIEGAEVKVKYVKELNFNDLVKYVQLQRYTCDFNEIQEYTNALVAVIGSKVLENKDVVGLGSNKFFIFDKGAKFEPFQKGLFVALGTFASVRTSFDSIRLNLNPTTAIFYKSFKPDGSPMNALDLIQDFLQMRGMPREADIKKAQFFMKGVKIYRAYLERKTGKAIQGFNFRENADTLKFKDDNGNLTSVRQYFKDKWKINLKFPNLPLLKIGPEAYLPMELAYIMPQQQYNGEVWDTRNLIRITSTKPMEKARLISKENSKLFSKVDFGKVDSQFTVVPSRVLSAPVIEYSDNKKIIFQEKAHDGRTEKKKGNWNLERIRFVEPTKKAKSFNFGVCIMKNRFLNNKLGDLQGACIAFFGELSRLGVNVNRDFKKYSLDMDHPSVSDQHGMEQALTSIFTQAKTKDKIDYLIVILHKKDTTMYRAVKRVGDLKVGVINTCVVFNVFTKKLRGSDRFDIGCYSQIAMKINLKLGGSNHRLSPADSKGLFDAQKQPVFILGADVTHPTGQVNAESISVASVVGSEDGIFNKFPGSVSVQRGGQEVIQDIFGMVLERIENYVNKIGKLPNKVLFYRDGVSEGQYYTVLKEELTEIKRAFVEYGKRKNNPHYGPKITFMVVVKRHHTRFIPLNENAPDSKKNFVAVTSNDNVSPGTVVDRDITHPAFFDFYIQSQQALQGCGIPAHYYVLHDENNYESNEIQTITYNLCHTFGRATKSIKTVPAAYYADLLCTRGRDYIAGAEKERGNKSAVEKAKAKLGNNVAANIRNTMYYI
ncbi:uncharacterized protein J8A68_004531 [[Candida] subhashii]|uniref:Piwi domain-containing protein n=1 Tax=[Candida] subhashii TaxID=561895 RepID=A0A8J5QK54_9ASCO|nr:uncharacterized protein J8A68_004531 [[Candida] subhashii]KAG7661928.1 hypothetical protein J8A68_004531 [[Candida] subhashii]